MLPSFAFLRGNELVQTCLPGHGFALLRSSSAARFSLRSGTCFLNSVAGLTDGVLERALVQLTSSGQVSAAGNLLKFLHEKDKCE